MTKRLLPYFLTLILLAPTASSCITYTDNQTAVLLELSATDTAERTIKYVDNSEGS